MRFESIPFFDEVVTPETRGSEFSHPLEIFFCLDCASVQTRHDVNLSQYYHTYQYVGSRSPFVRTYMQALTDYSVAKLGIGPGDRVIEVGAADGYLLSLFQKKGAKVLGFEAAENLCGLAGQNGVSVIQALFTDESLGLIPEDFRNSEMLVLLHTFDHLPEPARFLETARRVLDPQRGVLLLEVHDLADIYRKRETALFGHEHATYLHLGSMRRFLKRCGFRLVDWGFLPKSMCRGSSMVVAASPQGSDVPEMENPGGFGNAELDELSTWERFQDQVSVAFQRLRAHIERGKTEGRRFAGYGGWGRGVTTLAMAKLNESHLEFVVDGNTSLHGGFTPVTGFRIVGPEAVLSGGVDEVIVFNYAYMEEIRKTLQPFLDRGGRLVAIIDFLGGPELGEGDGRLAE